MVTKEELDAIEARANAATMGPWHCTPGRRYVYTEFSGGIDICDAGGDDSTFIAAARADIPALIAEVRRLQVERDSSDNRPDVVFARGYRKGREETLASARYSTEAVDALLDLIERNEDNFDNVPTRLENAAEAVRASREPQR